MLSKLRTFAGAAVWSALTLVGCSSAPPGEHGPSIGVILDYTGTEASGVIDEQALLLAAQLMTDSRKGDPPFRFVYRDARDNADDARRAASELVQEGVDVVIGPSTDRLVPIVAQVLDDAGIVLVSPNTTIGDFGRAERPWFRLSPGNLTSSTTPALIGEHMARQFVKRGARRALIVSDDDVYDVELVRGFKAALADDGGQLVEQLGAGGSLARHVVDVLGRDDVDAVVVALSVQPAASLISDVSSSVSKRPTWMLPPRLKSDVLLLNTPVGSLDGAFGVSLRISSRSAGCGTAKPEDCFVDVMQRVLGDEPFESTYFMYDAAAVALIAADRVWRENHEAIDRSQLNRAIFGTASRGGVEIGWNEFSIAVEAARAGQKIQYAGATGPIVFTSSGLRLGGDTIAFEVKDHVFVDATH